MGRSGFSRRKIIMNARKRIAQRPKAGEGGAARFERHCDVRLDQLKFFKLLIKSNNLCSQVSWQTSDNGQ